MIKNEKKSVYVFFVRSVIFTLVACSLFCSCSQPIVSGEGDMNKFKSGYDLNWKEVVSEVGFQNGYGLLVTSALEPNPSVCFDNHSKNAVFISQFLFFSSKCKVYSVNEQKADCLLFLDWTPSAIAKKSDTIYLLNSDNQLIKFDIRDESFEIMEEGIDKLLLFGDKILIRKNRVLYEVIGSDAVILQYGDLTFTDFISSDKTILLRGKNDEELLFDLNFRLLKKSGKGDLRKHVEKEAGEVLFRQWIWDHDFKLITQGFTLVDNGLMTYSQKLGGIVFIPFVEQEESDLVFPLE